MCVCSQVLVSTYGTRMKEIGKTGSLYVKDDVLVSTKSGPKKEEKKEDKKKEDKVKSWTSEYCDRQKQILTLPVSDRCILDTISPEQMLLDTNTCFIVKEIK